MNKRMLFEINTDHSVGPQSYAVNDGFAFKAKNRYSDSLERAATIGKAKRDFDPVRGTNRKLVEKGLL